MKTSNKCILSVSVLVLGSIALSGCGGRSASNPTTISYHQIGVCKSYATPTGTEAAKPNEAFAVFKVETIDNTKPNNNFDLDVARVYVDQTGASVKTKNLSDQVRRFMITGQRLGQALGVKTLGPITVPAKEKIDVDSIVVVPIKSPAGGPETDTHSFDLIYDTTTTEVQTGTKDIVFIRTNTADTKYQVVEDCKDLPLK